MPSAIRINAPGGPEVMRWEEVAVGDPGPGEARIRHTAVGVNYIDTYHRSGLYKLPMPSGLGSEGAGTVEATGPGVDWVKAAIGSPIAAGHSAPTAKRASCPRSVSSSCPTASPIARRRR
jgi:NADPH2:quinone reductase